ncbi:15112_t:CDS:10 [Entrophospora sp. SA101]|nr:15112_t:CDS:10 [Entrophospora sp. SA101]
MSNSSEETGHYIIDNATTRKWVDWIERAIEDEHINFYDYQKFENIHKIGMGGFGKVYKANLNTGDEVALKSFYKESFNIKEVVNENRMNNGSNSSHSTIRTKKNSLNILPRDGSFKNREAPKPADLPLPTNVAPVQTSYSCMQSRFDYLVKTFFEKSLNSLSFVGFDTQRDIAINTREQENKLIQKIVDEFIHIILINSINYGKEDYQIKNLLFEHLKEYNKSFSDILNWLVKSIDVKRYALLLGYIYYAGIETKKDYQKNKIDNYNLNDIEICIDEDIDIFSPTTTIITPPCEEDNGVEMIAAYFIGYFNENGYGTEVNKKLAFKYLKYSSDKGCLCARSSLGYCYLNSIGIKKNETAGFRLFNEAANKGNIKAKVNLGYCYENGVGTTKDLVKAFQLYQEAAENGNIYGQYNLAFYHENGYGTAKNIDLAIKWYSKAANTYSLLNTSIQEIKTSLSVLPLIQQKIDYLAEVVKSLEKQCKQQPKVNGIVSSPPSDDEDIGSIEQPKTSNAKKEKNNTNNINAIATITNNKNNNIIQTEKKNKKLNMAERKRLRKARKKQLANSQKQSADEASSDESEAPQSSPPPSPPLHPPQPQAATIAPSSPQATTAPSSQPTSEQQIRNANRQMTRIPLKFQNRRGASPSPANNRDVNKSEQETHPQRDTTQREKLQDNWKTTISTFEEMDLKPQLLNGIRSLGYDQPTSTQKRAISAILSRKDCVIQVPHSKERALTYLAAIFQQIDPRYTSCQAIILVHLKDLCYVIEDYIHRIAKDMQISSFICIGGYPLRRDIERLKNDGQQIIVATPGRLIDLMAERRFDFSGVKTVIIEDSCIMFNSTFRSQAFDIIFRLPRKYQRAQRVLMTTATTFTLADIKNRMLEDPAIVTDDVHVSDGLTLYYSLVDREDQKLNGLCEIFNMNDNQSMVIFCDNAERVNWLADKLSSLFDGVPVFAMHSFTEQSERYQIIKSFWDTEPPSVMITVDCFASVLAFNPVKCCLHFDVPFQYSGYRILEIFNEEISARIENRFPGIKCVTVKHDEILDEDDISIYILKISVTHKTDPSRIGGGNDDERVNWLADKLSSLFDGVPVFAMHSFTEQSERYQIIKSFWDTEPPSVMITVDCFALCCCGGYGIPGININLVNKEQVFDLNALERYYKVRSISLPKSDPKLLSVEEV